MPRARLPQLHSITDSSFEPNRKNPIFLRDDEPLDDHLKRIRVGGQGTPLSLAKNRIEIDGGLSLDCNNLYLDDLQMIFQKDGDIRWMFSSTDPIATFGVASTALVMHENSEATGAGGDDFFYISVGVAGQTTIGTVDNVATAGTITIKPDGNLELVPEEDVTIESTTRLNLDGGNDTYIYESSADVLDIKVGAVNMLKLDETNDRIQFTGGFFELLDVTDNADFFRIRISDHGETVISTVDDGAAIAHLALIPDGDLVLDPESQKTIINATDSLYFDGGGDTYITEVSADILDFYVGGTLFLRIQESTLVASVIDINSAHVTIDATKKLFFDGAGLGHTYITESADDVLDIKVGGDIMMKLSEKGDDGNEVSFGSSCVGFTQLEPTYDATTTVVDFRHSNKQFVTFGAGNITSINCIFPLVSGNFVLLLKQDGTGSRTVTNWKASEFDETLADGSFVVKFARGSNPTLTTDANHVDIISFYWDADNEIAYGVATLDFQF